MDQTLLTDIIAQNAAARTTWFAGATSMLRLSGAQRRAHLGYVPAAGEQSLAERARISAAAGAKPPRPLPPGVPATWDWRSVDERSFVSPVQDQGACGSCVAFGTVAAMDAAVRILLGIPTPATGALDRPEPSVAQLFCCGTHPTDYGCSLGWNVTAAMAFAQSNSLAPSTAFPWTAKDCSSCPADRCARKAIVPGYPDSDVTRLTNLATLDDATAMKQWLSTEGPLITVFTVYEDFFAYFGKPPSGSDAIPPPGSPLPVGGRGLVGVTVGQPGSGGPASEAYVYNGRAAQVGGHCVCVVGYDESRRAWLCKNSWGTGWGMSGYFCIQYGQCGIDARMWGVAVAVGERPAEATGSPPT